MVFVPASSGSLAAFIAILVAVCALIIAGGFRAGCGGKVTLGLAAWIGVLSLAIFGGALDRVGVDHFMPLVFFFACVNIVSLGAGLSPLGRTYAQSISVSALVAFQAFRLPLELVLHRWAEQGTIPETMTWTGRNLDIISGIVALIAAPWAQRLPVLAWIANLIGAALLLNVMRVALLSSPVPFGWGVEPPLQLALHLPYALIAPICVGGALAGHVVLTRALLMERSRRS